MTPRLVGCRVVDGCCRSDRDKRGGAELRLFGSEWHPSTLTSVTATVAAAAAAATKLSLSQRPTAARMAHGMM